jgi:hypothetical protein
LHLRKDCLQLSQYFTNSVWIQRPIKACEFGYSGNAYGALQGRDHAVETIIDHGNAKRFLSRVVKSDRVPFNGLYGQMNTNVP